MGISISTATVIGVSFIDKFEREDWTDEDDNTVSELGLSSWVHIERFDTPSDVYVGEIFYDRPTDAQVAEATQKVTEALPKLREAFGEPSSPVEVWKAISVG